MTEVDVNAVLLEEREAFQQHRHMTRMQREAARARERAYRERLREALRETRAAHPRCKCDFTGVGDRAALIALGGGCTDPNYVCTRLDAVRRRMGV